MLPHLTSDGWHFKGSAQPLLDAKLQEVFSLYLHQQAPQNNGLAAPQPVNNNNQFGQQPGPPAAAVVLQQPSFNYVGTGADVDPEQEDGRVRFPRLARAVANLHTPRPSPEVLQKLRRHPVVNHRINRVLVDNGELDAENDSDISDCEQLQISRISRPPMSPKPRVQNI